MANSIASLDEVYDKLSNNLTTGKSFIIWIKILQLIQYIIHFTILHLMNQKIIFMIKI